MFFKKIRTEEYITEVKKNTLEGTNSRLEDAEGLISILEDMMLKITPNSKEKNLNKESLKDI